MGKRTVFAGNGQSAMPAAKRKASGKDKSRRKTAAMLAVLMGLSWAGGLEPWQIESFGAVSSEGGQENIVVIETAEDFLEFSALCTSETYSQGKAFAPQQQGATPKKQPPPPLPAGSAGNLSAPL